MSAPTDELADLVSRLEAGWKSKPEESKPRAPKPIYDLVVDDPDERSIMLIIRTGEDGVARAMISLPAWYELPEFWEGPYDVETAIRLADEYAWEYGYYGIAVDIESSQLWNPAWGKLETSKDF